MANYSALVVQQAQLSLGNRPVLQGVDLELAPGQVVALLGGSGCGKTTLLRAIAGLQPLDAGAVMLNGRDVTALPTPQRGIGMVFQQYALFPNLSVRENVAFGLHAGGWATTERAGRVAEVLALVGLEDLAERRPGQLSGGQRQRVALARALAPRPSLLLLDEPFSALDESFRVPLRRGFRELQAQLGQSCVLVTHDRDEAYELADRVAVMFDGRIEQWAPPVELWQRPATRRVAEFLGVFNHLAAHSAPDPWRRHGGSWMSPMAALQIDTEPSRVDGWRLSAQVIGIFPGRTCTSVDLRAGDGQRITLLLQGDARAPARGTVMPLFIPTPALDWLPD